jgi:hypothetical protein
VAVTLETMVTTGNYGARRENAGGHGLGALQDWKPGIREVTILKAKKRSPATGTSDTGSDNTGNREHYTSSQ